MCKISCAIGQNQLLTTRYTTLYHFSKFISFGQKSSLIVGKKCSERNNLLSLFLTVVMSSLVIEDRNVYVYFLVMHFPYTSEMNGRPIILKNHASVLIVWTQTKVAQIGRFLSTFHVQNILCDWCDKINYLRQDTRLCTAPFSTFKSFDQKVVWKWARNVCTLQS